MEFLKKNYEKVLLGVVLLGMLVALGFLPFIIAGQKQSLMDLKNTVLQVNPKPLTNLDMTLAESALKRAAAPAMIDFGPPNRLFNPMPWQQTADKRLLPLAKVGPTALVVTNITELWLKLTLDKVNPPDPSGAYSYVIGVDKPAATGTQRTHNSFTCTTNPPTKNKVLTMIEVKGQPENPQVVVQLNDTGEKVTLRTNQPFARVEGYVADLKYDPEKKRWDNVRVNSKPLPFNGEEYNIVAINKDEVVLSAKSNGKKWTIKSNAAP